MRSPGRARVEFPREETRGGLEDLVGPAQLADLALQLGDAPTLLAGHPGTGAAVDLGLAHPAAQGLAADAQLAGHAGDRAEPLPGLLDRLQHHADRALAQLGRVA